MGAAGEAIEAAGEAGEAAGDSGDRSGSEDNGDEERSTGERGTGVAFFRVGSGNGPNSWFADERFDLVIRVESRSTICAFGVTICAQKSATFSMKV